MSAWGGAFGAPSAWADSWGAPSAPEIPEPPGPGGSGRRYNTDSLDPSKWAKNRRKLESRVAALQERMDAKRRQIDLGPSIKRVEVLRTQIASLQVELLKLLAQIDMMRKQQDEENEFAEVVAVYMAYIH